jgi:hypothetical protein
VYYPSNESIRNGKSRFGIPLKRGYYEGIPWDTFVVSKVNEGIEGTGALKTA